MNILIDGRAFSLQRKGGVSQMWAKILASNVFQSNHKLTFFLYPKYKENLHFMDFYFNFQDTINIIESDIPSSDNTNYNNTTAREYRQSLIEKSNFGKFDFVINTYYGENICKSTRNYIVIAHDFAHEELEILKKKDSTINVLKLKSTSFLEANVIISVSNTTRLTGYKYYPTMKNNCNYVIYHGHDITSSISLTKVKKQILYVGGRGGYKNFNLFLDIIENLLSHDSEINIIIAGGEELEKKLSRLVSFYKPRIIFLNNISDNEMNLLYMTSSIYLSTSLYEGFGIPVLYSLHFNTIPVLSDIPVYNEIAGSKGIYFKPHDKNHLMVSLKKALNMKLPIYNITRSWEAVANEYNTILERKFHESENI